MNAKLVRDRVGPQQLGLTLGCLVLGHLRQRAVRRHVQMRRYLAELEIHVDQQDRCGVPLRRRNRRVDGDRRRAHATLGAEDGDHVRPSHDDLLRSEDRREIARAPEAQQERLHARLELEGVVRLRHDIVGAGLQEPDPLVDVVGLADAQHRDGNHGGRRPDLATDVGRRLWPREDVQDDQVMVTRLSECLDLVRDGGDAVTNVR